MKAALPGGRHALTPPGTQTGNHMSTDTLQPPATCETCEPELRKRSCPPWGPMRGSHGPSLAHQACFPEGALVRPRLGRQRGS